MHIKRYEARTLQEALERVKRELGPDALILSSRTVSRGRGAFGLLSRSVVEVQAAQERGSASLPNDSANTPPRGQSSLDREDQGGVSLDRQARLSRTDRVEAEARREFEEEVRSELRGLREAMSSLLLEKNSGTAVTIPRELSGMGLDPAHCTSLAIAKFFQGIGRHEGDDDVFSLSSDLKSN